MRAKKSYTIHEAKTNLSKIIKSVENGEEAVLARAGTPVARIIPYDSSSGLKRTPGLLKGLIRMKPDFDEHLDWDDLIQ